MSYTSFPYVPLLSGKDLADRSHLALESRRLKIGYLELYFNQGNLFLKITIFSPPNYLLTYSCLPSFHQFVNIKLYSSKRKCLVYCLWVWLYMIDSWYILIWSLILKTCCWLIFPSEVLWVMPGVKSCLWSHFWTPEREGNSNTAYSSCQPWFRHTLALMTFVAKD